MCECHSRGVEDHNCRDSLQLVPCNVAAARLAAAVACKQIYVYTAGSMASNVQLSVCACKGFSHAV